MLHIDFPTVLSLSSFFSATREFELRNMWKLEKLFSKLSRHFCDREVAQVEMRSCTASSNDQLTLRVFCRLYGCQLVRLLHSLILLKHAEVVHKVHRLSILIVRHLEGVEWERKMVRIMQHWILDSWVELILIIQDLQDDTSRHWVILQCPVNISTGTWTKTSEDKITHKLTRYLTANIEAKAARIFVDGNRLDTIIVSFAQLRIVVHLHCVLLQMLTLRLFDELFVWLDKICHCVCLCSLTFSLAICGSTRTKLCWWIYSILSRS